MVEFNPKKMRVFLDIDDVLADWAGECVKLIGLNTGSPVVQHALEETWGIGDLLDENRMWDVIHSLGENWWANLTFLPWGEELWLSLNSRWPVTLLSSPSKDPSCLSGKKKWIDTFLPDAGRNFLIGRNKHWCANPFSVLVDDRPRNCDEFVEAGGHAYLWPNATKMNRLIKEGKLRNLDVVEHCIESLKETEKIIDSMEYSQCEVKYSKYDL